MKQQGDFHGAVSLQFMWAFYPGSSSEVCAVSSRPNCPPDPLLVTLVWERQGSRYRADARPS